MCAESQLDVQHCLAPCGLAAMHHLLAQPDVANHFLFRLSIILATTAVDIRCCEAPTHISSRIHGLVCDCLLELMSFACRAATMLFSLCCPLLHLIMCGSQMPRGIFIRFVTVMSAYAASPACSRFNVFFVYGVPSHPLTATDRLSLCQHRCSTLISKSVSAVMHVLLGVGLFCV
jgi:hypothetical protein